jgi:hypothetical protein
MFCLAVNASWLCCKFIRNAWSGMGMGSSRCRVRGGRPCLGISNHKSYLSHESVLKMVPRYVMLLTSSGILFFYGWRKG